MASEGTPTPPKKPRRIARGAVAALLAVAGLAWWWTREDAPTLRPRAAFRAHGRAILTWYTSGNFEQFGPALAFSPDSATLATAGEDGSVKVWDATDGSLESTFRHEGKVESLVFSPDGRTLFAEGHGSVPMIFVAPEQADGVPRPPPPGAPTGFATELAPPAPMPPAPSEPMPPAPAAPMPLAPSAPMPPAPGGDPTPKPTHASATCYEVASGRADPLELPPRVAARSDASFRLLSPPRGSDPLLTLWDESIRRTPYGLWGRLTTGGPVLIAPGGKAIASALGGDGVALTDASGRERGKLTGHLFRAPSWAFSPDGRMFVAGSWDGSLQIHDLATATSRSLPTPASNRTPVAISPDGKLVASVAPRRDGAPMGFSALPRAVQRWIGPYVLSPNRFSIPEDEVFLREMATGRARAYLKGHKDEVTSIVFSPDGKRLATADWDGYVRLWDVP